MAPSRRESIQSHQSSPPTTILLVDDDKGLLESLSELAAAWNMYAKCASSAAPASEWLERNPCNLVMLDIMMPGIDGITFLSQLRSHYSDLPVVMMTGQPSLERAIASMREGAVDFLVKPFEPEDFRNSIHRALKLRRARGPAPPPARGGAQHFVGESETIRNIQSHCAQLVAAGCEQILIIGETGTGKEVVAREIHAQSGCADDRFVALSCPSLPDQLVESELFGHVKGSFTGADSNREGMLSLAAGGTLFLDEIADLSHHGQATLLRTLETRRFRPVGSDSELDLNARVIAATNAPVAELAEGKQFRHDLYFRLAVHQINIPPLRERREDILPLAYHFLERCRSVRVVTARDFDDRARRALLDHDYPGNARELCNIIERAAVMATGEIIDDRHLQLRKPSSESVDIRADRFENRGEAYTLLEALEHTKWNRRKAAELLGMPYSTLRYKMKILGID